MNWLRRLPKRLLWVLLGETKIWERWYQLPGWKLHVRLEPLQFKETVLRIGRLIDDGQYRMANIEVENAYRRWGCDPELVRLGTVNRFMGEVDQ